MKHKISIYRYLILFAFVIISLTSFGQSVYMHEAQDDSTSSDLLSFKDILYGGGLFFFSFMCFIWAQKLKTSTLEIYKKNFRISLISFFSLLATSFATISIYNNRLYQNNFEKARDSFYNICNNAETYVNLSFEKNYCVVKEIDVRDFNTPSNQLYRTPSNLKGIIGFNNTGINGVYYCFEITSAPTMEVVFAKEANRRLGTESAPSLYHCFISPYRIRYFNQNPNPSYDVLRAYVNFRNSFLINHNSHKIGDTTDFAYEIFSRMLANKYFKVSSVQGGDEIWADNKMMYEYDVIPERVYEYKTVNYGNFEIMYCIIRPTKLGINESYIKTPKGDFEMTYKFEQNKSYYRDCRLNFPTAVV